MDKRSSSKNREGENVMQMDGSLVLDISKVSKKDSFKMQEHPKEVFNDKVDYKLVEHS